MKKGSHKRAIRMKDKGSRRLLDQVAARLSRAQALRQILALIEMQPCHPDAIELIELFNIQGEELAEAGLPYETLKALEKRSLVLRRLC